MTAPDGRPFVLYDNVRPATPSGKVELASETLAGRWGAEARLPRWRPLHSAFPLNLITPASDRRISSTLGGLARRAGFAAAGHEPGRCQSAGASSTGSRFGCGTTSARSSCRSKFRMPCRQGVIATEKGAWLATSPTGQTVSALVSADDRADLAQGACFNDARVEVEAAAALEHCFLLPSSPRTRD